MVHDIDAINRDFYNHSGDSFDKIPFDTVLPHLVQKYRISNEVLDIGSGAGALAAWLTDQGCRMTCLEPAEELAARAAAKGLRVLPTTIQKFQPNQQYDSAIAISSLIHVPKEALPAQIEKIAKMLKPRGLFIVSFIEGENEGFEDPSKAGKLRFFAKWSEGELDRLLSPYFDLLESRRMYRPKMDRTFLLQVRALVNRNSSQS